MPRKTDLLDVLDGGTPPPAPLNFMVVRELTQTDIQLPRVILPAESSVLRIRHQHHMAARLVAEGRPTGFVALMTGYSPGTISQLRSAPAFQELVAHYKDEVDAKWVDIHGRLSGFALSLVDELQRRLEEDPDSFSKKELRELFQTLAAKSLPSVDPAPGHHGGASGPVQVNVVFEGPGPASSALAGVHIIPPTHNTDFDLDLIPDQPQNPAR